MGGFITRLASGNGEETPKTAIKYACSVGEMQLSTSPTLHYNPYSPC